MPEPLTFTSSSPRFGLPLLFPGQAQKEFFANQAHVVTDALLHPSIEGEAALPPPTPAEGEAWLVTSGASQAWSGQDSALASWQAGVWIFIAPSEGMQVFDKAAGQFTIFRTGAWMRTEAQPNPDGGVTIDSEARQTLTNLMEALRIAGILPSN